MKEIMDPTGVPLRPSWQGRRCKGNGFHPEYECCCDECDYFLGCYPQYDWRIKGLRKKIITLLTKNLPHE